MTSAPEALRQHVDPAGLDDLGELSGSAVGRGGRMPVRRAAARGGLVGGAASPGRRGRPRGWRRRSCASSAATGTSWLGWPHGLRGIDASVTFTATGAITREMIQPTRGWTDEDWEQSVRRLQARGLLDAGGRLTKNGGALRRDVEDVTDRLAAGPVERLGSTGVERAIELATPISRRLDRHRDLPGAQPDRRAPPVSTLDVSRRPAALPTVTIRRAWRARPARAGADVRAVHAPDPVPPVPRARQRPAGAVP